MRRAAILAILLAAPAAAIEPAVEAALAPPPGAVAGLDEDRGIAAYPLPVAAFGGDAPMLAPIEGRVRVRTFRIEGPLGTLALTRRIRDALVPLGFETALFCADARCGGYDFRFALAVEPQPAMLVNLADFRQLTMTRALSDGATDAVSALASRLAGVTHVQIVTVTAGRPAPDADPPDAGLPGAEPPAPAPSAAEASGGDPSGRDPAGGDPSAAAAAPPAAASAGAGRAPEPAGAAAARGPEPSAPSSGAALIERLRRDGRVALEGVDFVAGSSRLDPAAGPALDAVARALAAAPELSVAVVGHTDGEGGLAANLRVSEARAAAVRDALVARGVTAARLEAAGAGWLAPRASNATPEGRAVNRRVELVAR